MGRSKMKKPFKCRIQHVLIATTVIFVLYYFGVFTHVFEKDFYDNFEYPLNEDILYYVDQLKNQDVPSRAPINVYNYTFTKPCRNKCRSESVRLVLIIKSALENSDKRAAIRNTFGYERRFSDVNIKTVFLVGTPSDDSKYLIQKNIDIEDEKHHDIIQANFVDNYYNNTIKTMMGFKWVMEHCSAANFYMFSDDDMYISIKNVLRFVRNPSNFPEYVMRLHSLKKKSELIVKRSVEYLSNSTDCESSLCSNSSLCERISEDECTILKPKNRTKRQVDTYYDFPDDSVLYSGYMFHTAPHRHRTSKWYTPLDEYPYHLWPPYISAGAYILSREALTMMYYASLYTVHFRFDDIYLGILAKKCAIKPFHCKEFYFYKKDYDKDGYKYVIASHGYGDPKELSKVWNEQKESGNA